MLALNIITNWAVIFMITGLVWSIGAYPGDYTVLLTSAGITAVLIGISLTSAGERIAVIAEDGRKPTTAENDYIYPYLLEVSAKAKMKLPNLYIFDSCDANAKAVGRKSIILNTGLLNSASPNEICGVIAHELGHLYHKDTAKLNTMCVLNRVGAWLSYAAVVIASTCILIGRRIPIFAPIFILVLTLKGFQLIIEKIIYMGMLAIGRKEELRADQFAAKLGYGDGLSSYLRKRNPYSFKKKVLTTHPPVVLRLEKLSKSPC